MYVETSETSSKKMSFLSPNNDFSCHAFHHMQFGEVIVETEYYRDLWLIVVRVTEHSESYVSFKENCFIKEEIQSRRLQFKARFTPLFRVRSKFLPDEPIWAYYS